MHQSGKVGATDYEIDIKVDGRATVRVWRDYSAGGSDRPTAQQVWRVIADFGGIKTIFPSLLSVYLTYPDATEAVIKTMRHMIFAPPDQAKPLTPTNPLAVGVEQLVELDEPGRRLTYISVFGLPVRDYRSVMEVSGKNECRLTWTSSFSIEKRDEAFVSILAHILAEGTNQIAKVLT